MARFSDTLGRAILIFSILLLLITALGALVPIHGEGEIYDNILRLHVLANSDSEEDQALKLKVRDAVLEVMRKITETNECGDFETAIELVNGNLAQIKQAAENVIRSHGYDYSAEVEVCRECFPTREYDGVRLPAGEYSAVRVLIGKASGKNWWCVLYPTLCLDSSKPQKELVEAGFTNAQIRLLTDSESPRYVLRFRFLEWLGNLTGR